MAQAGPNKLIRSSTISCHSESRFHLKEGANELRPQRSDSEIAGGLWLVKPAKIVALSNEDLVIRV